MKLVQILLVALVVTLSGCGDKVGDDEFRYMFEKGVQRGGSPNEVEGLWSYARTNRTDIRFEIGEDYFIAAIRCRMAGEDVVVGKRVSAQITDNKIKLNETISALKRQGRIQCGFSPFPVEITPTRSLGKIFACKVPVFNPLPQQKLRI